LTPARRALKFIAPLLLSAGVAVSWLASKRMGMDFASYHLMARALVERLPIYSSDYQHSVFPGQYGLGAPPGMFYPPATGFALLPFAFFSYPTGQLAFLALMLLLVVLGVRAIVRAARPFSGNEIWMATSGIVLLSSCIRWGTTPLQGAPIVFALLSLFAVALYFARWNLALGLAIIVTTFKITLALPFLGGLLLYRRYGATLITMVSWGLLNFVGFLRLGGGEALRGYRANMAVVEALYQINTPDPWDPISIPRLDWTYLFNGLTGQLLASRMLGMALSVATALWLASAALRLRQPLSLRALGAFLSAFVCLGTLAIYHHQYDVSLFVAPLLLLCFTPKEPAESPWAMRLMFPLVAMGALLPVGKVQQVLRTHLGEAAVGLMNLSFPIATSLALVGSLLLIQGYLVRVRKTAQAPG
jgi:hypothetical protein